MPYLYTRVRCCETPLATLDPKYDEVNGAISAISGDFPFISRQFWPNPRQISLITP